MIQRNGKKKPNTIMDLLYKKFVQEYKKLFINNENEDRNKYIVWQQLEKAHWHYFDYIKSLKMEENYNTETKNNNNNSFTIFVRRMGRLHSWLQNIISIHDVDLLEKEQQLYEKWKKMIPVYGCILFDEGMNHVLLVRGKHEKSSWTFPRGKLDITKEKGDNQNNNGVACAIREVFEEIGLNVSDKIDKNKSVSISFGEQKVTMYVIEGINKEKVKLFVNPKEIGEYVWFSIEKLCMESLLLDKNQYRFVIPFIEFIRKFQFNHDLNGIKNHVN